MRAPRLFLIAACVTLLSAYDVPAKLEPVATGSPAERVVALWEQTRPIVMADAKEPLTDSQALARGAPLVEVWSLLESSIVGTDAGPDANAVIKLLNDLYGRPESTPQRRMTVRNDLRANFGQRLQILDRRLSH